MARTSGFKNLARTAWNRLRNGNGRSASSRRTGGQGTGCLRLEGLEQRTLLSAGPYAPAAGQEGSTAISKDDTAIVGWATGYENYIVGDSVSTSWQTPEKALGEAAGNSTDIVCLGRGGQITLTFDVPIVDGPGWDFATFENGFSDTFLELGYVEVSSNGTDFFRFSNDSLTESAVGAFGSVDATQITGYCSKYKQGYGTPFDLAELDGVSDLLDVNNISYVRIVDIVGDGTDLDSSGDVIYDPYPTSGSAGVDLEAVAVLNNVTSTAIAAVTFEDVGANLADETSWNGSDESGGFLSGGVAFNNSYDTTYGSWEGWAYSNTTDTTTAGYTNQYSAYVGAGAASSSTYAVAYASAWGTTPTIELPAYSDLGFESITITNTTYAALSMLNGDSVAKQFGGESGSDEDWFLLTITGVDADGASVGTVDFYLADYTFSDNSDDYVVDEWVTVDLTSLDNAVALQFSLSSSDVGDWGMNTPAYFAIDDVTLYNARLTDFEDVGGSLAAESHYQGSSDGEYTFDSGQFTFDHAVSWSGYYWDQWTYSNETDVTTAGYTNQFSAYLTETDSSNTYAIAYSGLSGGYGEGNTVTLDAVDGLDFQSLDVTNTTYAALSMLQGDDFARQFGYLDLNDDGDYEDAGEYDGDYPDWFLLTITGYDGAAGSGEEIGTIEFYLADYRSADDSLDYVVDDWTTIDLTSLGEAASLAFSFSSSDNSVWGMNTPAYVAVDNIVTYDSNVSTFEDVGLALGEEEYGPVEATGVEDYAPVRSTFTSGPIDYAYSRTIDDSWYGDFWEGFAYSNMTDTTTAGMDNQYSAYVASPLAGNTYAVAYDSSAFMGPTYTVSLELADGYDDYNFESIEVANTTYAALSMLEGDDYAKQFGGETGDDEDWFLLTIEGKDSLGNSVGTVEFYLADYRFSDNSLDYVVDEWTTVDLTSLAGATELEFSLSSSDVGTWGMNTPAYFAVDNIVVAEPAVVTLQATDEDDVIAFVVTETQYEVTINGEKETYDRTGQIEFYIDGLEGSDRITIVGTDGNEDAVLDPDSVDVTGSDFVVHATSVETISVDGGGGENDTATLTGSTGSNRLYSYDSYSRMSDSSRTYSLQVDGFEDVSVDASEGSGNYAFFYDSADNEVLSASPEGVDLSREDGTTSRAAAGFEKVYVYATSGGDDSAELTGVDGGRNRLYSYADYTTFTESARSFYFYVRGFDSVEAASPGDGTSYAYIYDSTGDDSLETTPTSATMDRDGGYSDLATSGFARVYAYATQGGTDSAVLNGSDEGGNRYRGYPTYSTLTDATTSFYTYARGFDSLTAIGSDSDTSGDRAYLYDSNGNDTLTGELLENDEYQGVSLTDEAGVYKNAALYFDLVYARSSDSGTTDTIDIDEDLLACRLIEMGTW